MAFVNPSVKHMQKELLTAKQKSVKLEIGVKFYFVFSSLNEYIYLSALEIVILEH